MQQSAVWGPSFPSARNGHSLAVDAAHHRTILFGGAAGIDRELDDTWELLVDGAGRRCARLLSLPGERPAPRWGHKAVCRTSAGEMVLFGGSSRGELLGDVWKLSLRSGGEEWQPVQTRGAGPSARVSPAVVYLPTRDSLLVIGGHAAVPANDVWELDLGSAVWRQILVPGSAPAARSEACAFFDAAGDRLILALGKDQTDFFDDVWALSLESGQERWTQLAIAGVPPTPRAGCACAADAPGRRLYVFGGWSYPPMVFHDELFRLDLASMEWQTVQRGRPSGPDGRRLAAAAFDAGRQELSVVAGENRWRCYVGDAWSMRV